MKLYRLRFFIKIFIKKNLYKLMVIYDKQKKFKKINFEKIKNK